MPNSHHKTKVGWMSLLPSWAMNLGLTGIVSDESGTRCTRCEVFGQWRQMSGPIEISDIGELTEKTTQNVLGRTPVCASLSRQQTLVRYLRLPTRSASEIEAMIPHMLASELPMAVEKVSWVWRPLVDLENGFCLVSVYIARTRLLEELAAPLLDAGVDMIGFVPEACAWAYFAHAQTCDPKAKTDSEIFSFLIDMDNEIILLVERAGKLLFDYSFGPRSESTTNDASELVTNSNEWQTAQNEFTRLFDTPLPEPRRFIEIANSKTTSTAAVTCLSGAVAAVGLLSSGLLAPPSFVVQTKKQALRKTAVGASLIALIALVGWFSFTVADYYKSITYLELLNERMGTDGARIEELEIKFSAIKESRQAAELPVTVLGLLDSLGKEVKKPIFLENFNYVAGRSVTIRGRSANNEDILELAERLGLDPLWEGLRVRQLRTGQSNGSGVVYFQLEVPVQ